MSGYERRASVVLGGMGLWPTSTSAALARRTFPLTPTPWDLKKRPRAPSFEPVLSGKALAYLLSLKKRHQRQVTGLLYRLAEYPHQPGDYESEDDTGRPIQHLRAGSWVISFWPDDSSRELRVIDIDEL